MKRLKQRKDSKRYMAEQDTIKKYVKCVAVYNLPRKKSGKKIEWTIYTENHSKPSQRYVLVGYIDKN